MKLILPGGTGQVGGVLARGFAREGHEVVVLSRTPQQPQAGATRKAEAHARIPGASRVVAWDGCSLGQWTREIEGADVVINLAGYTVNCRYNAANRARIMDSRVNSTRAIGQAIAGARNPPAVWLQSSTATIYAHRFDAPNDESTGILGGNEPGAPEKWRFSIDVATAWERAANEADTPSTRKVLMRSAMVMSPDRGGVFDTLLGLVRKGLGGRAGDGRQYVSWIHHEDFTRAVQFLIERDHLTGPVNIASPNPLPNAAFMRALRRAWGSRVGLPATKWMLEVGAIFMRTETELILKSRRVIPGRLLEAGFAFNHPTWGEAVADLTAAWRESR